jgi:3-dehydrotetronate 4-kinase
MSQPLLGCIADDYTGATDVAAMLSRAGLKVIQCFGVPSQSDDLRDADAIVVALKSRSIAPADAVKLSLEALAFLQSLGVERFFFKYCSTFDSTVQGNIGPVADALANELEAPQVLFCPAFPENGRTVYCGHLFVHGVPLNESGMQHHPLTPMTDSNLVRVLQAQSQRRVAKLSLQEPLPNSTEPTHFIVDAITNVDLEHAAQLAADHRLLTGGSAVACFWATALLGRRSEKPVQSAASKTESIAGQDRCIVLAGSCSEATRKQIAEFAKSYPVLHLDLASLASVDEAVKTAIDWCNTNWNSASLENPPLLVSTSAKQESVAAAREKLGQQGAADFAEHILSRLAKELHQQGVGCFIVAGGETAGAIINALGVRSVRIGEEISPGIPWITTLASLQLKLTLKSGNFGGPNFFLDAWRSR